jgi:hypothetical protein
MGCARSQPELQDAVGLTIPPTFEPVILESPLTGPTTEVRARNQRYLTACIRDCIDRGETPYASHKMLPGALDDDVPEERMCGIAAGFAWRRLALRTVVYTDLGLSRGMEAGIAHAVSLGLPVVYRELGADWDAGDRPEAVEAATYLASSAPEPVQPPSEAAPTPGPAPAAKSLPLPWEAA